VLVVEDDDDARTIYAATLEHAGYEVVCARTVKEGAAVAELRRPSAVVLECRLPDGSGLELLKTWRAAPPMSKVPVVVVTSHAHGEADPEDGDAPATSDASQEAAMIKPCPGDTLTAFLPRMIPPSTPTRRIPIGGSGASRAKRPRVRAIMP
jgi:DNA-binding response OmpR family regulator